MKKTTSEFFSEAARIRGIPVAQKLQQLNIRLSMQHLESLSALQQAKDNCTIVFKLHLLKSQTNKDSFRKSDRKLYIHSITDTCIILSDASSDCPYFLIPIVDYGIKYGLIRC